MTMTFLDIRISGWFEKELTDNYHQELALLGERAMDHYKALR